MTTSESCKAIVKKPHLAGNNKDWCQKSRSQSSRRRTIAKTIFVNNFTYYGEAYSWDYVERQQPNRITDMHTFHKFIKDKQTHDSLYTHVQHLYATIDMYLSNRLLIVRDSEIHMLASMEELPHRNTRFFAIPRLSQDMYHNSAMHINTLKNIFKIESNTQKSKRF